MPSYHRESYYYDVYDHDSYYQIPYPPSNFSQSDGLLVKKKKGKTLSKAPVRTKPGPNPTEAIQKLERGVRKVCRKASEVVIEVCTKIYEKSRATVSTAIDKHRSKIEKSHPTTVSFTSKEFRGMKISNPQAMYYF